MTVYVSRMVLIGYALLVSCSSDQDSATAPDNCADLSAASLEGEWEITAQGERYSCDGARDDGEIEIAVKPFRVDVELKPTRPPVTEAGDEADAFVDRVSKADVKLSADLPNDVTFEGGGGSDCKLHFTIREKLSNGNELDYNFEGFVQELDQATGTLSGSGPGECKVRGTFTLDRF